MKSAKDLYLIISIDVEEDMPNWKVEKTLTLRNIRGLPRLQETFDRYGVRPTYLLDYPYAVNAEAVEYFCGIMDKCEIGAHLHPWNTPPLTEDEAGVNEFPSNLTYERQSAKLKTVTDELTKSFGKAPTSYRAGRFGFNRDTNDILEKLGYLVDSSVTPMVSWKNINGPDFTGYPSAPFWLGSGESRLLEIPVTIGLNRKIPAVLEKAYQSIPKFTRLKGLMSRDYLNLLDIIWLYPVLFQENDMLFLVNAMLRRSENVFNVFFHSNEISVGESIYTKTEKDLEEFYRRLEFFLDHMVNEKNAKSVTLTEYRFLHKESTIHTV
jgi:hypothetical protein